VRNEGLCYVEVKNVHMSRKHGLAEFPDSVTERGVKHLAEMSDMVRAGHRAVMVYLVQRGEATKLAFARDVDPATASPSTRPRLRVWRRSPLRCRMSTEEIVVDRAIPIVG
jgi:sugar fermentation stimulation protein A